MSAQIHTISFGFVNVFLLTGEKTILIDAGMPGQADKLWKGLAAVNTKPEDIDLLIITHGHYDHIGLAKEIVDQSGARTAIHTREVSWVETGNPPAPPGITLMGKLMINLLRLVPQIKIPPTAIDITLEDDGLDLNAFGIPGQVIYTPGHTMGSMSVLLENGDTVVGDLAGSTRYMTLKPGMPIFAEDESLIKPSWKKLLDLGAQRIYPAHGKPFSADALRNQLTKQDTIKTGDPLSDKKK